MGNTGTSETVWSEDVPHVTFTFPESAAGGTLWLYVYVPTEENNSWFVNGNNVFEMFPVGYYWQWVEYGTVDTHIVKLQCREAWAKVKRAYLGDENPLQLGWEDHDCGELTALFGGV